MQCTWSAWLHDTFCPVLLRRAFVYPHLFVRKYLSQHFFVSANIRLAFIRKHKHSYGYQEMPRRRFIDRKKCEKRKREMKKCATKKSWTQICLDPVMRIVFAAYGQAKRRGTALKVFGGRFCVVYLFDAHCLWRPCMLRCVAASSCSRLFFVIHAFQLGDGGRWPGPDGAGRSGPGAGSDPGDPAGIRSPVTGHRLRRRPPPSPTPPLCRHSRRQLQSLHLCTVFICCRCAARAIAAREARGAELS